MLAPRRVIGQERFARRLFR